MRRFRFRPALAAALLAAAALPATARCLDEDGPELGAESSAAPLPQQAQPRDTLRLMVAEALSRSHQVGAAKLMAEAAQDDIREAQAGKAIQASVGAGVGPGGSSSLAGTETSALQVRGNINVGQLLYDGGRVDRLTDWRTQLAESARHGALNVQEQLALNTVSLALERSRFRQQVVVYGQYVRKMACIVEALETIVRADRGRASELVQARKSMQQAEMAQAQAQSQARQVEVRLRRLVGDGLPGTEGMAAVLLAVAPVEELVAGVERSAEVAALAAQATAMNRLAEAIAAGRNPQLSWTVTGSQALSSGGSRGNTRNGSFAIGLALNVPLAAPSIAPASEAARKRARAAELQRAELLEQRRFRVAEVHEQTSASFDRARRVGAVLRDSQQVRNFTLQQWQQLGRRSLFDVMGAEAEHYNLRIAYVNALHDGQQLNANLLSLGRGLNEWLQ
jgi:outer membrane protein, adhesin transport system